MHLVLAVFLVHKYYVYGNVIIFIILIAFQKTNTLNLKKKKTSFSFEFKLHRFYCNNVPENKTILTQTNNESINRCEI